jgi:hypothetical protein
MSAPRFLLKVTLAIALVFATAFPLFAQVDRGIIEAIVLDESGATLPGVTVTARRPETGQQQVEVTGTNGVARFPSLPPGTWELRTELSGFAGAGVDGISLRVGQTARVNFTLRPTASETITVEAASEVVDVYKTDASTNILPEQIEMLPVADRDFQRLAFIAPGVQRERGGFRFIGGGPVIGGSPNASQATILVDGVDYTDPALGLSRTRFSQDAIREFRVIQNRFDVEVGGSSGGALSIVTKSGTNDLKGSVFGFYRDDALREPGALEQDSLPFSRHQLGFTVGGPIALDRTHFFFAYENVDEENIALFRPGGAFVGNAADVEHPFKQHLVFGSIDHILGDAQSLMFRGVWEKYREDNFRVGGIADVSYGQELQRDNWNASAGHTWTMSAQALNELRAQIGSHKYFEPTNSDGVAEWFSSGTTLQTGGNILGDLLGEGDFIELRDTYHRSFAGGRHALKAGAGVQFVDERFRLDTFETGLFIYVTDTRALPLAYAYGVGSGDASTDTSIWSAFIEDEYRPTTNLTLNFGLRYDLDTHGNNPDIEHPLVPGGRDRDDDNFQPRFGFNWDVTGQTDWVVRGGAGLFTGRMLLVPALTELQANGVTGRRLQTRINGALLGFPTLALDPANPTTTGIPLPPDITLLDRTFDAPQSTQVSLGLTHRLGNSGLYFDADAIWVDGKDEIIIRDANWNGNANPTRPIAGYNQINTYTNDGYSEYKALILGVNGTVLGKHIVTGSVTLADKKNINDDFSPEFPFGYPNDPANIDAEYGRSRADERYRIVLSGVFRAPWDLTVAPVWEYGSGQPWTHRLGYDFNADGKNSDRPAGVGRNEEDGPRFTQLNLRLTKAFQLATGRFDVIVEGFNILDTTNYDVNSVNGAEFFSGPTLANPNAVAVRNPAFGTYRATLPGREIQLGLRYSF